MSRSLARPRRRRIRGWILIGGLPVAALVFLLLLHVGWFTGPRPWQEATGWNRIPEDLRPRPAAGPDLAARRRDEPRIDWLGHSGFLVRWHGARILLDPNLDDLCTISRRVLERPIAAGELGPIDAVLISHAHYDHLDLPTLEAIRSIGTIVLPAGSERFLPPSLRERVRVSGLVADQRQSVGPLEIIAVPAAHNGNRLHPLASRFDALGYVVRAGGDAIYYAGDTGFDNPFADIGARYHPRLAILPIGAYAPRFPMRYYHLSPEEAAEAARILGVETMIPCHFGTFALSLDRPASALPRFARAARARGVNWRMPRLLRTPPGDSLAGDMASDVRRGPESVP